MTDNSHNTDLCLNIVDRVEQRDPVFLQALIEQAEKIAQRQVVRHGLPRDYALDVAQEALRRIMQRPERLAHIQDFRAYLQVLSH